MSARAKIVKKESAVPASRWTLEKVLPWLLLIGGLIGIFASLMLTIERFDTLANPHYRPVCNLNPIFSCSTVASSDQAHAFGFYNPFLGLIGYSVVATIGLALLGGAKFKKWFWKIVAAGLLFAILFITWLQFETLYRIGALCLFCMIAWLATIPLFWYTTLYSFQKGYLPTPGWFSRLLAFMRRHHGDILLLWFLIIIVLILKRFWYYWSTVF